MGTSQISSVPYVLSLHFTNISFGTFTFIMNMIFILIQVVLLKKSFFLVQLLQIPVNLVFSILIDAGMWILSWFVPGTLALRIFSLLLGCMILAFGISIEVAPNVVTVPGEGIVKAIAQVYRQDFGKVKVIFDVTLIVIASILSLIFFHKLHGVGFGTIVSALIVGRLVSVINHHVTLIHRIRRLTVNPEWKA